MSGNRPQRSVCAPIRALAAAMIRGMAEPVIRAQINNVVTRPASDVMPIPEIKSDRFEDAIRKQQTQIFYLVDVIVAPQEKVNAHLIE
jgi:hypothetical protein